MKAERTVEANVAQRHHSSMADVSLGALTTRSRCKRTKLSLLDPSKLAKYFCKYGRHCLVASGSCQQFASRSRALRQTTSLEVPLANNLAEIAMSLSEIDSLEAIVENNTVMMQANEASRKPRLPTIRRHCQPHGGPCCAGISSWCQYRCHSCKRKRQRHFRQCSWTLQDEVLLLKVLLRALTKRVFVSSSDWNGLELGSVDRLAVATTGRGSHMTRCQVTLLTLRLGGWYGGGAQLGRPGRWNAGEPHRQGPKWKPCRCLHASSVCFYLVHVLMLMRCV